MSLANDVAPRRALWVLVFAVLATPAFAMWHLGRGWLGVLYIIGLFAWAFSVFALFAFGIIGFPVVDGVSSVDWLQIMAYLPVPLIGIFHALMIRRQSLARPWFSRWYGLAFLILSFLLGAVLFRAFLLQPFNIPSSSMSPTLKVGDHLYANKFAYGYGPYSVGFGIGSHLWDGSRNRTIRNVPERGDVAIFRLPSNTRIDYIKRVIGVPGDRVQMKKGRLFLNGETVQTEPAGEAPRLGYDGRERKIPRLKETLPSGRSYYVLDQRSTRFPDNTEVYTVPDGHLFVLGDNRDNSTDSRFQRDVGFVPLENLVARASFIFLAEDGKRMLTWVR